MRALRRGVRDVRLEQNLSAMRGNKVPRTGRWEVQLLRLEDRQLHLQEL